MLASPFRSTSRRSGKGLRRAVYRASAVAAAATALAGVLPASSAHADGTLVVEYTGIIRNWATGDCLDAFANVNPCYDNGTDAWQQWNILINTDDTEYYIQNAHTGQCLDNGNGLYMWNGSCIAGDAAQIWQNVPYGTNYQVHFQNALTGLCLDDNGQLYVNNCNGGGYQTWRRDGSL